MGQDRDRGIEGATDGGGRPALSGDRSSILAINSGSSSLKFALFRAEAGSTTRLVSGKVGGIGTPEAEWSLEPEGGPRERRPIVAPDSSAAAEAVIEWLRGGIGTGAIAAVGHRVVHGGGLYHGPERITPELIAELHRISPLDPDHMPGTIAVIEPFRRLLPELPQVACFDTGFHHDLPRVARMLPLPRVFEARGVRRYGFHGLSYTYLMGELARVGGEGEARGRVILAHLGSGASLAAVRDGRPVDTSMGFTSDSGLVMGTRTGDIDPGLVRFLVQECGMPVEEFDRTVHRKSGLLGVSGTSQDVRVLLALEGEDVRAAEALALFCYQAKKWIGAFAAALGGLDTLVFSGGIGENAPEIRRRICEGLGFLGVSVLDGRNAEGALLISPDDAPVKVRVIPTDEEKTIAEATARLLS